MATTVERQVYGNIRDPQHEIIDVDDWIMNGDDFSPRRTRDFRIVRQQSIGSDIEERPTNRRRFVDHNAEVIVLDDSDDDDIQVVEGPPRVARDADQPAVFRRRRGGYNIGSPPPPPREPAIVPPVPHVPRFPPQIIRQYWPQRRHEPPATPPRVAPAAEEQGRAGEGRGMGLGGALHPRPPRAPHVQAPPQPRSMVRDIGNLVQQVYGGLFHNGHNAADHNNEDNGNNGHGAEREGGIFHAGSAEDADFMRIVLDNGRRNIHHNIPHGFWARAFQADLLDAQGGGAIDRILQRQAPDYKQSFTHPPKPASGFTFEFGPSETSTASSSAVAGSSKDAKSVETGTILVCACCMDPLVMNVTGTVEEMRGRRIWGLRCGHMIDGKCIEKIMKPAPLPPSPKPSIDLDKTIDLSSSFSADTNDDAEQSLPKTDKGKGKAKASYDDDEDIPLIQISSSSSPLRTVSPQHMSHYNLRSHHTTTPSYNEAPSSSRFILRPMSPSEVPSTSSPEIVPPSPARRARGRRGRARGARGRKDYKGKARAVPAPVIEETYEWPCPVAGCGLIHMSNKIDGEWKMDEMKDMGAIPIYV